MTKYERIITTIQRDCQPPLIVGTYDQFYLVHMYTLNKLDDILNVMIQIFKFCVD